MNEEPGPSEYMEALLQQLAQVPEPWRTIWEKRLRAKEDHQHDSVRLEIYLYSFFKDRQWGIEIEPELAGTPNRPDFRLQCNGTQVLVEAKTVFEREPVRQQYARLMDLAQNLSGKLSRTVSIQPIGCLPSSLPNRHIASEIEKKARILEVNQEFQVQLKHQGQLFTLEVAVLLDHKPDPSLDAGVVLTDAYEVEFGKRMAEAVIEKADKYGAMDVPFVIAVWPNRSHFSYRNPAIAQVPLPQPRNDDLVALYGDLVWQGTDYSALREVVKPNGLFNLKNSDGTWRYSHISAVVVAQLDRQPSLMAYHNPGATRPLDPAVFKGIPQHSIDPTTGEELWLDPAAPMEYDITDPIVAYGLGLTDEVPEELLEGLESEDWKPY